MTACPICTSGVNLTKATIYEISEMIVEHHRQLATEIYKLLEWESRQRQS